MRDRDCLASQMSQMERRERAKVEQKEIDKEFAAVWERDRQNKEERHQLDIRRKKELELEDLKIRDLQLQEIARRKQEALVVRDEDRDKMRAMWSAEEEKARRKQEELKTYKDKSAKEFARFNEYRIIEKKAEIERNRAEDMKIVNAILEEGRLMDKREAEKKAMYMREIREYRDQLSRQMEKEKIDDRHLDILRYKEQEKEWDKREKEWEREEQLRAKLRAQVMAAREQQLREKKEAQIAERERDMQYKRFMAHQEEEYKQSLVKEADAAREKKQSIKEYLEWQLEQQQLQKDLEAQEAAFEREHARRTEEQLQQKINQTISGVNSYPTYYGKQKRKMNLNNSTSSPARTRLSQSLHRLTSQLSTSSPIHTPLFSSPRSPPSKIATDGALLDTIARLTLELEQSRAELRRASGSR